MKTTMKRLTLGVGLLALSAGAAAAVPAVVQTDLNLRSGPGPRFAAVAAMPAGATVDVGGCSGAWCAVNFDGAQGYANRAYLNIGSAVGPGYGTYAYGTDDGYYDPGYYDDYGYYGDYGYGPGFGFGFGFGGRGRHFGDHDHDRGGRVGSAGRPGSFSPRGGSQANFAAQPNAGNPGSFGQRGGGNLAPRGGAMAQGAPQTGGGTVGAGAPMGGGHFGGGGGGGHFGGGGGGGHGHR
jgi:uncharacterized protein YraI